MKMLLYLITLFTLVLASCANAPAGVQDDTPTGTPSAPTQASSQSSVEIIGGDEESYREFIRQWIVPVDPNLSSQDIKVYIGSTPTDMPYELPMPDDTRVIGSITGTWMDYILVLESSLPGETIREFYAESLKETGWKEPSANPGGGFTSQENTYQIYCFGENEAYLGLETPPLSTEKTSIRLSLDISPESLVCTEDAALGATYVSLIPELQTPKGMTMQGGGAGSSDRDANVSASLRGNLSAVEVAEFYNQQLVEAGWELQDSGDGEGAAWSRWTFQDEQGADWIGALMVVEVSAESNALFALVTIERDR